MVGPNDKKVYNEVKAACALNLGIPTQCLKINNLTNAKKFDSIMSKLIIQIAGLEKFKPSAQFACEVYGGRY